MRYRHEHQLRVDGCTAIIEQKNVEAAYGEAVQLQPWRSSYILRSPCSTIGTADTEYYSIKHACLPVKLPARWIQITAT
jgi:hypothetical protein